MVWNVKVIATVMTGAPAINDEAVELLFFDEFRIIIGFMEY